MFDRRGFVTGAALLTGALWAKRGFAEYVAASLPRPNTQLLESTFSPLASSLLPPDAWHPYPKLQDREGWDSLPATVRNAIVKRADDLNNDAWPQLLAAGELEFARNGNRTRYEALQFGRRGRLGSLVLGECVRNQGTYLDEIANGIWLICEETFWGAPAHLSAQRAGNGLPDISDPFIELFTAETAATLAWVVYLLGPKLSAVSPLLVPRIHAEVRRRIFEPYLKRDHGWLGLNGHEHHLNNWNTWINSNVLTAALLLGEEEGDRKQIVLKVCRSVDQYLRDVTPDGGCEEGPGYWTRSAASFFDCCWMLVSAHAGKGSAVLQDAYLRAAGHYIVDVHIAGRYFVNYGDAHVTDSPEPDLMYRFGKATDDSTLQAFGAYAGVTSGLTGDASTVEHTLNGLLSGVASFSRALAAVQCVNAMKDAPKHDALTQDSWYPMLGLMTARQAEGQANGFYVALQAASNGRSHSHNDSGSFLIFHQGEPVFIDVGVGAYEKKTFSAERYTIWTMQSAYHNLPQVGGVMEHEGRPYGAKVLSYQRSDASSSITVNLAEAYPKEAGITQWKRTLTLDRKAQHVVLQESFTLSHAVPVQLHWMTAKQPEVTPEGVQIGDVLLQFPADALKATVEKIVLTDVPLQHQWGEAVYRITLQSQAVTSGDWVLTMRAQ